jgi:hypothetical protein
MMLFISLARRWACIRLLFFLLITTFFTFPRARRTEQVLSDVGCSLHGVSYRFLKPILLGDG